MPFNLGPFEIVLILVIILIVFGVGRLPEVGGAIGRGLREFRKAQSEPSESETPARKEPSNAAAPTAESKEPAAAEPREKTEGR